MEVIRIGWTALIKINQIIKKILRKFTEWLSGKERIYVKITKTIYLCGHPKSRCTTLSSII